MGGASLLGHRAVGKKTRLQHHNTRCSTSCTHHGRSTAGRCLAHLAAGGRLLPAPLLLPLPPAPPLLAEGSLAAASSMALRPCSTSKCRFRPSSSLQAARGGGRLSGDAHRA